MATDSRSLIAGKYPQRFPLRLSCVLREGDIGVVESGVAFSARGDTAANYTFTAPLQVNDIVELSPDVLNVYDDVEGVPVVQRAVPGQNRVFGKLITAPDVLENNPTGAQTVWANMLLNKYYRTAMMQVWLGVTKVEEAIVKSDGANGVIIGVGDTLSVDVTNTYASHELRLITHAGAPGSGLVPMHYMAPGVAGDLATVLVGINGPLRAV